MLTILSKATDLTSSIKPFIQTTTSVHTLRITEHYWPWSVVSTGDRGFT